MKEKKLKTRPLASDPAPEPVPGEIHPAIVTNTLAFINRLGEPVFLAGDVMDFPDIERLLEKPSETN